MSETPPSPPQSRPSDLRLVLFGLPGAGKSSLLGALGQAAAMQEHLLGGRLEDQSQGLAELSTQVYEKGVRRTPEELKPYPVTFRPHPEKDRDPPPVVEAVLLDCDGRVAGDMMVQQQLPDAESLEGSLAHAVGDADTIILAVDGSTTDNQLQTQFGEFARFLQAMQIQRGSRVDVAGLPVFLVLTKCDLLAQPGDNTATWFDRIEQRKHEIGVQFKEFVHAQSAKATPDPKMLQTPFGRIVLNIWATAVKRPDLVGQPSRPRDPYGVAELFRLCLNEASRFRERRERSKRRLLALVLASVLLTVLLATFSAAMFVAHSNTRLNMLQTRVEDFRFLDRGGVSQRLKGNLEQVKAKLGRLEEIRDDAMFRKLPTDSQAFIKERIDELNRYIPYLEQLLSLPPLVREQTIAGLEQRIEQLRNDLTPPVSDWEQTPAGRLRQEQLDRAEALRQAVQAVRNWYLDRIDQAIRLWTFAGTPTVVLIDWPDWTSKVELLIDPKTLPPFREDEPVPGIPNQSITFAEVMRYDQVIETRASWESDRAKLKQLLSITTALGLSPATKARPAALVFSRTITLDECKNRLMQLKSAYPEYEKLFLRNHVPDVLQLLIRQLAHRQFLILLEPGRSEVLRQLKTTGTGPTETAARWESVRAWLRQPDELTAWRELIRVVQRLEDPEAVDPVKELTDFLGRREFPLQIRALILEIPELRGMRPREQSSLVIHYSEGSRQVAVPFEPSGEPSRDSARRIWTFTYRAVADQRWTFKPGDPMWADLNLTGSKEKLVWSQARSQMYQFERLHNPPRLQPVASALLESGRLMDDIRLRIRPEDGVPTLPALLPPVDLGR